MNIVRINKKAYRVPDASSDAQYKAFATMVKRNFHTPQEQSVLLIKLIQDGVFSSQALHMAAGQAMSTTPANQTGPAAVPGTPGAKAGPSLPPIP